MSSSFTLIFINFKWYIASISSILLSLIKDLTTKREDGGLKLDAQMSVELEDGNGVMSVRKSCLPREDKGAS